MQMLDAGVLENGKIEIMEFPLDGRVTESSIEEIGCIPHQYIKARDGVALKVVSKANWNEQLFYDLVNERMDAGCRLTVERF